jgi:heme A synthase
VENGLAQVHGYLGRALLLLAIVLALWGLFSFATRRSVSGGFRSSYLLTAGLTALQGLLGAAALLAHGHPKEPLHLVYGVFAVLFLPGAYLYAARRAADTEAMLLTGACSIVAIAYARGFMTG